LAEARRCAYPPTKTVSFHTLGCKLNQHETHDIERQFCERGWRPVVFGEPANVVVVNACTVTAQSDSRCRAALRTARLDSAGKIVKHSRMKGSAG